MSEVNRNAQPDSRVVRCEVNGVPWLAFEVEMFHTHVFVCEGTRVQMVETGDDALAMMGFEQDAIDDIGKTLADMIPNPLEHVNAGECALVRTERSGTVHVIRLDRLEPRNGRDVLTLSHECLHAALNILDSCGVWESGNHECLCYLHEYIFGAFLLEDCRDIEKEKPKADSKPPSEPPPSPEDPIIAEFKKAHFFVPGLPEEIIPLSKRTPMCATCKHYTLEDQKWGCRHPELLVRDWDGTARFHAIYCPDTSCCSAFKQESEEEGKENEKSE